MKALLNL